MTKEYPTQVCKQCGLAANYLTCLVRFGDKPLKEAFDQSTWHEGICDVCTRLTVVTEPRDFFYPHFKLLSVTFKKEIKQSPNE